MNVNHVAITGDLTNLSLGEEFAKIREILFESDFSPSDITVVPGNHDRYTAGSEKSRRFEAYLSPFITGDITISGNAFPFVRLRDGAAIIGLNSALSLPPFVARGILGEKQLNLLNNLLDHPEVVKRFPVFLIHHPPYQHPRNKLHLIEGLQDYQKLMEVISSKNGLILHGHLHSGTEIQLTRGKKKLFIGCIPSSTRKPGSFMSHVISSFKIYEIDENGIHNIKNFMLDYSSKKYLLMRQQL